MISHQSIAVSVFALLCATALLACDAKPAAPSASNPTPEVSSPVEPVSLAPASHPPVEQAAVGCEAQRELDALDPRKPVPLQPMMAWHQKQNMQDHLLAIQQIQDALSKDDWDAVVKASERIGSSPQMAQMCQHMGAGAAGFTEMALEFHRRADGIAVAAKEKDFKGTLSATANTLETCTSCHATYRQEIVDAATWRERTGSAHQPTMGHH